MYSVNIDLGQSPIRGPTNRMRLTGSPKYRLKWPPNEAKNTSFLSSGSVGRAVASDNRDPRFESSLQEILFTINCIGKTKIKKKRPRMDHF